jgi:hypothetical protein
VVQRDFGCAVRAAAAHAQQRAQLAAELNNFRSALARCATEGVQSGVRLILHVGDDPAMRGGGHSEARHWLQMFLVKAPEPTVSRP